MRDHVILVAGVCVVGAQACAYGQAFDKGDVKGHTNASNDASVRPDTSAPGAAADAGALVTCSTLKESTPGLTSGVHTIDVDGAGPLPSVAAYCDMAFDGGGWTLIQAYTGKETPHTLALQPATGAVLGAAPRPGVFGGLTGPTVQALANASSQVHIRSSFEAAGGPGSDHWITSRPPTGGVPTLPIQNLRRLHVLSDGTDGGFGDWTGPLATATKLEWFPAKSDCGNLVAALRYPSIYWACGNVESFNLIAVQGGHARWRWNDSSDLREPLEVYVR